MWNHAEPAVRRTVPRILLIDDDEGLASMLSEYLGESGLKLLWVSDGERGLRELARQRFDAVVLDIMLPVVDGFELLGKLRTSNDVPVLMLTAQVTIRTESLASRWARTTISRSPSIRESYWRA